MFFAKVITKIKQFRHKAFILMQKNYARNDIFLPRTDVQEADIQEDNKQTDRQKTGGHTTENAPTNNNAESKHVASGIIVTPLLRCYLL